MVDITPPSAGDINWDVPLNAALVALESAVTAVETDKVSKSGDTITGALTVNGVLNVTTARVINLGNTVNLYGSGTNLQTDNYFVAPTGQSSGQWNIYSGSNAALNLGTLGGGMSLKAGTNGRLGTATLAAGTVTVANTSVTANTKIFLSRATTGGTVGHLSYTKINGTSFTINSSSGTETSTVDWLLVEAS